MLDLVNNPNPTPEQLQAELDALPAQTIRPADDPIEAPDGAEPGTVYFDVPDEVPESLTPEELMKEVNAIQAVVTAQPIPFDDAPAEGKAKIIHDIAMKKAAECEANGDTAGAAKYRKTAAAAEKMLDYLTRHMDELDRNIEQLGEALKARQDYLHRLEPFLRKELKRMHQEHPETEGVTLNTLLYSVGTETVDEQELAELVAEFPDETEPGLKYIRFIVDAIRRAQAALYSKRKEKKPRRVRIDSLPTRQLFPLDPVNYQLTEGLLSTGAAEPVNMFMKKKKLPGGKRVNAGQVQVFVTIDEDFVKYSQPLDDIDGSILRNIYTLVDAGEMVFNLSHIWAMTASDGKRLSPTKAQELIERIHRLMQTTVSIDCQAYAKAKGIDCPHIITGQILPGVYLDVNTNRHGEAIEANIKCVLPVEEFPLLAFSRATNEITAIPLQAATVCGMNRDKTAALTNRRIIIREILLRRIFKEHKKPEDQVIKLSRIYEKVNANSKAEKKRARDDANNLLLEWLEQGTIYAFSFRETGRSVDAIVIAKNKEGVRNFPGLQWYAN